MSVEYRNAVFADVLGIRIDCEINHPDYGWIPYTLDPADVGAGINNAQLLQSMASKGDVAEFVPEPEIVLTAEEELEQAAAQVRKKRDELLSQYFDPIASNPFRWESMPEAEKQELLDNRQSLLDITDQDGFPYDVEWPVA